MSDLKKDNSNHSSTNPTAPVQPQTPPVPKPSTPPATHLQHSMKTGGKLPGSGGKND